jgi:hypothetical protein
LAINSGIDALHKSIDQISAKICGAISQIGIHNLASTHANIFIRIWQMYIHLPIRGGNHLHISNFAVNDGFGEIKLIDHAKRDGPPAGLGIIQLPFEQPGLDACLGENFRGTGSAGPATHHRHSQHLETCSSKGISTLKLTLEDVVLSACHRFGPNISSPLDVVAWRPVRSAKTSLWPGEPCAQAFPAGLWPIASPVLWVAQPWPVWELPF